jgi:hypothetical protein
MGMYRITRGVYAGESVVHVMESLLEMASLIGVPHRIDATSNACVDAFADVETVVDQGSGKFENVTSGTKFTIAEIAARGGLKPEEIRIDNIY